MVFFTCTHIHDAAIPVWADSDNAIAFLSEVLDLEPMDILAKFKQWACARSNGAYRASSLIMIILIISLCCAGELADHEEGLHTPYSGWPS